MKRRFCHKILMALVISAPLAAGSISLAQQPVRPLDKQAQVSDSELRTFAKVYTEYQNVVRQYEPKLRNAKDATTRKKIQDEANARLGKILSKEHMTADDYNRIFKRVNADENLRKKVLAMVAEERRRAPAA